MGTEFIINGASGANPSVDSALQLNDTDNNVFKVKALENYGIEVTRNGVRSGFLRRPVTKTASYTCLIADNGAWFNTKGASGTVVFTLPAVAGAAGVNYRFTAAANQVMTITAPSGTLVTYNNAAATSVSTGTVNIGHGFELICDGAFWYAAPLMYVTANTTVA